MNTTTILQIPIDKTLRNEAAIVASEYYGFSSLQEVVRVLLKRLARHELTFNVSTERYPTVKMSKRAEKRYAKMEEDFKLGRNVKTFDNVEDFLKDLNS